MKFAAVTTAGELIVTGASGVLHRDYTFEVDHDFRRWLTGAVKLGYGVRQLFRNGPARSPLFRRHLAHLQVRPATLWLRGEFRHDWLSSNVYGVDYQANLFLLTLRLQR